MQELLPNISKVYRDESSGGWGYSYLVKRHQGNLFFARMAKTASIENEYAAVDALGGIQRIYITDFHFAGEHVEQVAQRFNAPIYCSQVEVPKISQQGAKTIAAFDYTLHDIETDLSVIPTPGHTSGGVCYLLKLGQKRYLFTGDLLYFDGNKWIVGTGNNAIIKGSLEHLQALEYQILIGCGDEGLGCPYIELTPDTKNAFFERLLSNF